jgi:hypothetical protein
MTSLSALAKGWSLSKGPLFRFEAVLLALICFSAVGIPRLVPLLFGVLAAVAAIHVLTTDRARPLELLSKGVSIALLVFTAYLFINATWAPEPAAGLTKAATVLGLIAAVILIGASHSLRSGSEGRVLAKWALLGLICGLGFLLIEITFDEPIARFVNNHIVQVFTLSPKKIKIVAGEVTQVAPFELNRNATSLVLLLLPGLLFTGSLATTAARRASLITLTLATAAAVVCSQSGTSVVAFFVGGLVLALAAFSFKATRRLLVVGWTVATLLAVPLGALPYKLGWHHWTWLPPESVAARFYIWKYVADRVYDKPITGIGIRGTRALHLIIPTDEGDPTHQAYALKGREPRHPHNIYLQTWLELGAIGAVLLLVVGLASIWQMRFLPPILEGSSYALFAVAAMVGLSGFDLFQTWLLAALAFAWTGMMLAAKLPSPLPASMQDSYSATGKATLPPTRA